MTTSLALDLAQVLLALAAGLLGAGAWLALERARIYAPLLGAVGWYGLVVGESLPDLARPYGQALVLRAAAVYLAGTALLLVTIAVAERLIPRRAAARTWSLRWQEAGSSHLAWSTAAAFVSAAVLLLGREDLAQSWSEARSSAGIGTSIGVFLLLLAAPGAASAFLLRRWRAGAVALGPTLAAFVAVGSRAAILGGLLHAAWILVARRETRASRLAVLTGFAALGLLAHVSLRVLRGVGPAVLLSALQTGDLWSLLATSSAAEDLSGGESSIASYFVYAVHASGSEAFGFMRSIVRMLLVFVPGAFAGVDKPLDVTYELWASAYANGLFAGAEGQALLQESFLTGTFGSLHPTLFGELFASGGWASLVVGVPFFGGLAVVVDRLLGRMSALGSLLLLGPVLVGMLFAARGNAVIGFGYFAYLGTLVALAGWALRRLAGRPAGGVTGREPRARPAP